MTTRGKTFRETVVPQFQSLVGRSGLHIRDPVEDVQAVFYTGSSVSPKPASTDGFVYPVDSAAKVTITRLKTTKHGRILVRDSEGNIAHKILTNEGATKVPSGEHLLEFGGMGMKVYARVDNAGFRAIPEDDGVDIVFDPDTEIRIGARSAHSQPARTLTTTSEPRDLMEAISLFGNVMKTWSPERTWPTLRGHPPLLELESEPDIPEHLTPPETDINVTVPPDHAWIYPVAPLAYWLGATVKPGPPVLHVKDKAYPLGSPGGYDADTDREAFEQHVRDILQFTFQFDCAVRSEGFYDLEFDIHRRLDASDLSLEYATLYELPLADRVQAYLDLEYSFEELEEQIGRPDWRLTTDVQPDPDRATILPFLARDLAIVRCPSDRRLTRLASDSGETSNPFTTGSSVNTTTGSSSGHSTQTVPSSSSGTASAGAAREEILELPEAETMSQAWVGDGFSSRAAKASTTSYLQRLENQTRETSRIGIDVVVNDDQMVDEATVSDIYGTREHLDFDINVHQQLSMDELAGVFEQETDFVHYIGHVEPEGFDCADGFLSADQLGTVGTDTFVLNACASYDQGQRLVDRGAIAGVVTFEEVINSLATKIGKSMARLLNYGFPIGSATALIRETVFTGDSYGVVGDSNAALAQSNTSVPNVSRVRLRDDGRFDVSVEAFASWNYDVGSIFSPYIEGRDCNYVVPGELDTWTVTEDELDDYFDTSAFPVVGAKNLYWSNGITASELQEQLLSYGSSVK